MMTPFAIDSFWILRGLISQLHISLLRIVGLRFLLAWRQLLSVRPKFSDQRVQICREFTSTLVLSCIVACLKENPREIWCPSSYLTVHLKGELFCMGGSPSSQDVQDIREAVAAPEYELWKHERSLPRDHQAANRFPQFLPPEQLLNPSSHKAWSLKS